MRTQIVRWTLISVIAAAAWGCQLGGKPELDDQLSALSDPSGGLTGFNVEGTLRNGQTSPATEDTGAPRYRAWMFVGKAGDAIDVWVRSSDGDAVAWLLDSNLAVVTRNDDGDGTTDAHLAVTLTNPSSATYYIVFREFNDQDATFRVSLSGSSDGPPSLVGITVRPYFAYQNSVLADGLDRTAPIGFVADGHYDDGTTADLTLDATWSSTDLRVVSFGGTLTSPYVAEWIWGVTPGTATLVATVRLPQSTIGISGVVPLSVH
jgi:hypothetical protein